ncbi:hypothetical protein [Philodulcilactobacillus myokoensis]|uniref:hypothetical protein n=1 Tax=Philodulcilactobacillus myokoensis TaxID=2929573 RepID=UPI002570CFCA|nr:hypothetical protein [Philodulcilactobacillus myokoensis]
MKVMIELQDAIKITNWMRVNNHIYYHPEDLNLHFNKKIESVNLFPVAKINYLLYFIQGLSLALYDQRAFYNEIKRGFHDVYLPDVNHKYKHNLSHLLYDKMNLDNNTFDQSVKQNDIDDYFQIEDNHQLMRVINVITNLFNDRYQDMIHERHLEKDMVEYNLFLYAKIIRKKLVKTDAVQLTRNYRTIRPELIQRDFKKRLNNYEFHHYLYRGYFKL